VGPERKVGFRPVRSARRDEGRAEEGWGGLGPGWGGGCGPGRGGWRGLIQSSAMVEASVQLQIQLSDDASGDQ
jgi:hypothetical protein